MGLFPRDYEIGDYVVYEDYYIKRGDGCYCVGKIIDAPKSRDYGAILATDPVVVVFGDEKSAHDRYTISSEHFKKIEPLDAITRMINRPLCRSHRFVG